MNIWVAFGLSLVGGVGWTASRFGRGVWVWPQPLQARVHVGLSATVVDQLVMKLGNRVTK
jgi:hypothetical protein